MSSGFKLGKGRGMKPDELHAFLTETKIFAKVGTIGEDGWPNVNPAWYEYDGESFWLVTKELAGFCQNMRRDPRVTLCIDNPETPYRRVMVRGRAEVVDARLGRAGAADGAALPRARRAWTTSRRRSTCRAC